MNDLTPDSAAVKLAAAYNNVSTGYVLERFFDPTTHGLGLTALERLAAEHERIVASRIAAAEKVARVEALKDAQKAVDEEHLSGFWEPVRDPSDKAYDKAICHASDAISALITAAEAPPAPQQHGGVDG